MGIVKKADVAAIDFQSHVAAKKMVKSEISDAKEVITPDTAALILAANKVQVNDRAAVQDYADMMAARAWKFNGQPIIFDEHGKLLDGEKRLLASVWSGESFETLVSRGVKRDTVFTIDQHRKRSYTCVLEGRGFKNAGPLVRLMTKLIHIEKGSFGKPFSSIGWDRYDQVVELNEDLVEAVNISEGARGCPLHSTARPTIAYMALAAGKKRQVKKFFADLSSHKNLKRGHPAKELAIQLKHDRLRGIKTEIDEMIVMGIQALNDILAGRGCEEPYGWSRDYGECGLNEEGLPISRRAFMEDTPANLGMPVLEGYPGIELGKPVIDAKSFMIEQLRGGSPNAMARSEVVDVHISPEVAEDWLNRYNTSNRKMQMAHVKMLARDMASNNWKANAQPIVFAGDPFTGEARLLNGQHRLEAIKVAGVAIEVKMVTGVDPEAFATFDNHSRHTRVKTMSRGDERVLAAAAKYQWFVDKGVNPNSGERPSKIEIAQTIEAHPSMLQAFQYSRKQKMQDIASAGILTFFIYNIRRDHAELAESFLNQLGDGDNLERGNPIIPVRARLIGKRHELTRREVLSMLMEAWKEYREFAEAEGLDALQGLPPKRENVVQLV